MGGAGSLLSQANAEGGCCGELSDGKHHPAHGQLNKLCAVPEGEEGEPPASLSNCQPTGPPCPHLAVGVWQVLLWVDTRWGQHNPYLDIPKHPSYHSLIFILV